MKKFTQLYNMISRECIGNASGMHRVKSRIHTFLPLFTIVLMLMVGAGNAWGNSVNLKDRDFDGKRTSNTVVTLGGNHVSFTLEGSTDGYYTQYIDLWWRNAGIQLASSLSNGSSKSFTFKWAKNDGCTLTINSIRVVGTIPDHSGGYVNLGGATSSKGNSFDVTKNNVTGNSLSFTCYSQAGTRKKLLGGTEIYSTDFNLTQVVINYTIKPDAPGVNPTTKTVNVTLPANTANPTMVNYKVFTTSDHYGNYWNYEFSSNPNDKGVMSGDNFYATEAGTYKIHAKINAETNCHTESDWSDDLTITVNRLNPTLTYTNGTVDVSVNTSTDKCPLNLNDLKTAYTGNGTISYDFTDGKDHTNGTISGSTFYATEADKTYYITATSTQTGQYAGKTANFTVTVNKRTPTIVFARTGEDDHIYSGNTLSNMAKVQYNSTDVSSEQVGFWYWFDNPSWFSKNSNDTMQILVSTNYYEETKATLHVTTKETSFYKSVTASHEYDLEVKKTPEFYLNGVLLDQTKTTDLNLEIDSTATFTFDKITSGFQYPDNTKTTHFTYNNETGVLTATVAGDEPFFFNEPGDAVTFQHKCDLHLYVTKHTTELSTILKDNDVWMVDSVTENSLYTLVKGDENVTVNVSSDNTAVINKVDGKWKAVGAGTAKITISQAESDKWSGASITRTIKVNRYDPEFTWNLPETVNYNTAFATPVSSDNKMEDCTFSFSSDNASVINWINGALRTFEKAGTHVGVTVTQAGNYKWNEKSETFYVNVEKLANHVEIHLTSAEELKPVNGGTNCTWEWTSSGVRLGGSSTAILPGRPCYNWDDKTMIIAFEGIPDKASWKYRTNNSSATDAQWYVKESPDGVNWSDLWSDTRSSSDLSSKVSKSLKPDTRYLLLCYSGNFAGYFNDLKITERTEIRSGKDKLDFGSEDAGTNPSSDNVNISWYNVNPLTLSIIDGDGKYSVSPTSIESSKDSYAIGVPLTVSYKHDAAGTHKATLRISDGVTTKDIALTGTTNKVTPAITWKENLSPMSRGENVTDPAEALVELVYTSSDSTVVDVEGNVLKPLKKGTATITASYDGSESLIYNSNSSSINVLVTNLAVQHIHWTQSFTRLKWSDDPVLSEKNTPDFDFDATVSYYDPETEQEVEITDRAISYTSGNEAVVKVLEGNKLHVVGQGNTTLTAYIAGITDSLYEATVIRDVIVREPTLDCEKWVLENKSASMETEINSYTGVETVYDLSGEPGYLSFEAWREAIHVIIDWTGGNLFVAEKIGSDWHELTGEDGLALDENYANRKTFDSIPMSREATQVKIYKKTGSTGIHAFSGAYVTLARYLELENTKDKKTHAIDLNTTKAKPGVAVDTTFTVNYSNITDQLDVELMHGDKFSIVSGATIGNECGDKGKATVRVRFLSNDVDLYKDTLLVHNLTDTVYVYLSADVDKHHPQITWEPSTTNLKTTDNVTFNATTSASAAGLTISYAVTAGSDVASVDAATGVLTIIKNGDVTIEARCEGNAKYYDAEPVPNTFHIEKVTPTITTAPSATGVTLPATLAASNLSGGEASVGGTFAWTNPSTTLVAEDVAYEVTFTPENGNWFNTTTCMVAPQVSKATQTIDWSFNATEMYGNADYTFDATASSGLTVTYSSSKNEVASVNDQNKLVLHKAGESVTITATQAGNEIYLPASEERTFTVLRWTPSIEEYPVGGTMYVGRILSDASLDGGRAEVGGQKVEGSFVWENANSATIDVPGPATHNVIFVPQNGNFYNEVNCGPIALTVLKYLPVITSNTLTADGIEFPQTLENSNLHGSVSTMDYVHIPNVAVTGHVEWKTPTTILRPGMQTATAWFVPDNGDWYENVEIPVSVQVTGGYVFNGDNTDWTEENNWAGNLVPTGIDDPVLINEDVDITTSVTVGSLTIKEGVDVVIKDGGVLTIGNDDSETRTAYGNLHVENGGQVILGEGKVMVNDFTLEAKLGDAENVGMSGQILNPATLKVNGNAYFDLALDPSGECSRGWYDFTVPFPVDALNGVTRFRNSDGEERTITNEVNYAIMDFSESRRLETGYGWKKFHGIMQPGQCYTITIDDVDNVYRFKKTDKGAFNNTLTESLAYTETDNAVRGWNGLGNGTLSYVNLSAENIEKVQVYSHSTNSYTAVPMDTFTYVVGSAYFIQAPSTSSVVNYSHGGGTHVLRAPLREGREVKEFTLTLTEENATYAADRFYVSASEDAMNSYTIGRELTKFGNPTESKVAQVWTEAYGLKLCDVEMPLNNSTATCALNLFSPNAGQYMLSVEEAPENTMLYLTYNGRAIWNLTYSPYALGLTKGTTEGYGLKMYVQQVTTDLENGELLNGENAVRKVLIDDVIYIVTPEGKMYDITGKSANY